MANRKVINAKENTYNGIKFKSRLETSCYKLMRLSGLDPSYETMKFTLMEGFKPTTPFYNSGGKGALKADMKAIRPTTYTPDFTLMYGGKLYIIEAKGIETDSYKLKKKLFRRCLENLEGATYFEVRNKSEILTTIQIIKNGRETTKGSVLNCRKVVRA